MTDQPVEPNVPAQPKQPMTASQAYEQMTMRESPATEHIGKTVDGVTWNDDVFATFAGVGTGVTIDSTKAINWNSTGDRTLREEQAQALRDKYFKSNKSVTAQTHSDYMDERTATMNKLKNIFSQLEGSK